MRSGSMARRSAMYAACVTASGFGGIPAAASALEKSRGLLAVVGPTPGAVVVGGGLGGFGGPPRGPGGPPAGGGTAGVCRQACGRGCRGWGAGGLGGAPAGDGEPRRDGEGEDGTAHQAAPGSGA